MIGAAVRAMLLADAAVAAIVVDATREPDYRERIYPMKIPQGAAVKALPALVMQHISDVTAYGFRVVGPIQVRLQLTAWATTYDVARDLAQKARLTLEGRYGEQSGEQILGIFHLGGRDLPYEKDEKVYGHAQDFEVIHKAAVAA